MLHEQEVGWIQVQPFSIISLSPRSRATWHTADSDGATGNFDSHWSSNKRASGVIGTKTRFGITTVATDSVVARVTTCHNMSSLDADVPRSRTTTLSAQVTRAKQLLDQLAHVSLRHRLGYVLDDSQFFRDI